MGSMGDVTPLVGQYMLPFITENTVNDDPWQRNYGQPPKTLQADLVPRSYPLIDIRSMLSENSAADLLKSHGFGVVNHRSPFIDQLNNADGEFAEQAIKELYHPEIEQLVKDTVGAKHVVVMGGALRQGKRAPEEFKMPSGFRSIKDAMAKDENNQSKANQQDNKAADTSKHKLAGQSNLTLGARTLALHNPEARLCILEPLRMIC